MKSAPAIRRRIRRVKAIWAELDYAQRRLFEIRTGVPIDDLQRRRNTRRAITELEALYDADEGAIAG